MTTYFTEASMKFLRGLARHNDRAWFLQHKAEYDTHVRAPFQRLLADDKLGLYLQPNAGHVVTPVAELVMADWFVKFLKP